MMYRFVLFAVASLAFVDLPPVMAALKSDKIGDVLSKGVPYANAEFALDLHRKLAHKQPETGNVIFSPLSISLVMSMVYEGALSTTAAEIEKALHMANFDSETRRLGYGSLVEMMSKQSEGIEINLANRLFVEKTYPLLETFTGALKTYYKSTIGQLDFKHAPEPARSEINSWVEKQTKSLIKDLLPAGSVDTLTALVVANAIYFKGDWAEEFKKEHTMKREFTLHDGSQKETDIMFHEFKNVKMGAHDKLDCQMLELPYKGGDYVMLVVLPNRHNGLPDLESALKSGHLAEFYQNMYSMDKLEVHLPKFKQETDFELKDILQSLGIETLFTPGKADLSGIDGSRLLYVSSGVHKASIGVDELGSEAAAASAVVMRFRSARRTPSFEATHPFLYMILNKSTGMVMFTGRYMKPAGLGPK